MACCLPQRKRVHAGAHDDDVLLAVLADVGHRVGLALSIELGFPQKLAGAGFEGAETACPDWSPKR